MGIQARVRLTLAILLLAAGAFCLRSAAQPAAKSARPAAKAGANCGGCPNCQSPRKLENATSAPASFVSPGPDDGTILYHVGGTGKMAPKTLHRCSQHYHCWIENLQPLCPGQTATENGGPPKCPDRPPVNSWVEIHTAYAPKLGTACQGNYETTKCCETDPHDPDAPIVVLGYHAKVTAGGTPGPVPTYWGQPVPGPVPAVWGATADEWSGSTTGPNSSPNECKPAAQWSFALGCDFTVSEGQLALFTHPEPARGLQPADRLSPLKKITRHK
jgi:hypothetical protein